MVADRVVAHTGYNHAHTHTHTHMCVWAWMVRNITQRAMTVRCSAENLCTLSLRPCFVQVSRCGVKVACELHNSSCRAWHHWNGNVRGHLSDEVDIWTAFVSIGTGKAARCGAQKALVAPTQCTHKT